MIGAGGGALRSESDLDAALIDAWTAADRPEKVMLAVSGGGDSMALLARARALTANGAKVCVATVDHRLRPDAAGEAAMVAAAAEGLGFSHETLAWLGDKPSSGLQEAAREARYRLLYEAARRLGAGAIITAHSAEDLAETFFMRLARGAGVRGLSGMALPVRITVAAGAPLPLLRPFIRVRRAALRAAVGAAGLSIIDDPSNEDAQFERVRMRRFLAAGERDCGVSVDAIARSALRLADAAAAEGRLARRRAADLELERFPAGFACCALAALNPDGDAAFLARLIHSVSGAEHPPDERSAQAALLEVLSGRKATLRGAVLAPRRRAADGGGRLFVYREPAALLGRAGVAPVRPVGLAPGERTLWDRRFVVENVLECAAELAPIGNKIAVDASLAASGAPEEAIAAAPALFPENADAIVPWDAPGAFQSLADERFSGGVIRFAAAAPYDGEA